MLGLDLSVALALVLSVASAVLCVGYGLTRWNADADDDRPDPGEDPVGDGRRERSPELGDR
ncbi:MAG TPA: hypothetical protein VK858_00790 [Longimicrobiales bacterium]|nr:hypothetical protein [Longimicrobiales bacterium]